MLLLIDVKVIPQDVCGLDIAIRYPDLLSLVYKLLRFG